MYNNVVSVLHNRWIQALGVLLALVAVGYLIFLISPLLTPLLLALLVAYLLDPVVDFLEARGIRRSISATGLAVISGILLVLVPLLVVPRLVTEAHRFVVNAQNTFRSGAAGARAYEEVLELLPVREFVLLMNWDEVPLPGETAAVTTGAEESVTEAPLAPGPEANAAPPQELTDREAWEIVVHRVGLFVRDNLGMLAQRYAGHVATAIQAGGTTVGSLLRSAWGFAVEFLAFLVNFSVFAFATGYLLVSFDTIVARARDAVPPSYRKKTYGVVSQIDVQLRSFVRGQLLMALVEAVLYGIGLSISGVPFSLVIGPLTGFLAIIPYLGVALGLLTSTFLVFLQHGLDWHIAGVLITFGVVQTLEEVLLRPLIVGDKVGLHPVWVMAALLVFGHAFGFVGVLAAVPIAAVLKVLVVEAYDYYRHSEFFKARAARK